ncbi:MAG: hypothetical protein Q9187_003160 [Circinaria calcarea]
MPCHLCFTNLDYPAGSKTGPITGQPPQLSSEATAELLGAQKEDPLGQHAGGQDGGDEEGGKKIKSEKELEKERKKAEKDRKFAEKQAKAALKGPTTAAPSKTQEKKAKLGAAKDEPLPEYREETPAGEKKILKPLDDQYHKAYNPKVVESGWYAWWEKQGFMEPEFAPDGKVKKEGYFSIPIPPPNVTGALHMGHAITNALQDTMIRWNRMLGKTTLWIPGCDHAGIATQNVIENMLWRRQKKTRHDVGREELVRLCWTWKDEYHTKINNVLRRMGSSVDFSREVFTLSPELSAAVNESFVRLHSEGLIYRANRLVSWDCQLNTALSNLEVVNKELEGRTLLDVPGYEKKIEFGILTHFKYEIEESDESIEIATTRPETMLGDSGIAVHPADERYKHLIGKNARHPFIDRLMPIVADDYVDPEDADKPAGRPAHDANDFALGQRHSFAFINILNDNGTMNHNTGDFNGMKRFDARYKVIAKLKEKGLYVKWEHNAMKVPISDRSKDVIEPVIKPQWWMRMQGLADAATNAVKDGEITIRPESAQKSYLRWMENVHDWCLSRQLWWGHQIPAYFVEIDGKPGDNSDGERWIVAHDEAAAKEIAKVKFPGKRITLTRDPDVLDTWFSSGLWPFSTLGWPKDTPDMERLFPQSMLETGWDILFFWVSRMIMLSLHLTKKVPFREVYCHSLVRDSEGRKMSKSLGNVIDPLGMKLHMICYLEFSSHFLQDVIEGIQLQALHEKLLVGNLDPKELTTATRFQKTSFPDGIPECGADALRFSLVSYTTGGGDLNFDVKVIHGYRRFCNKIYQATKYVLGRIDSDFVPEPTSSRTGKESLAERWILHKLTIAAKEINQALTDREFSQSTSVAYQYWYTHLCDAFIENSKSLLDNGSAEEQRSTKNTLYTALEGGLTMIHPFMPFLTEELWQRLPRRPKDSNPTIVKAAYPTYDRSQDDSASEEAYELLLAVSKGIRSLMAEYAIKDNGFVYVQLYDSKAHTTCTSELPSIRSLSGKGVSHISILGAHDHKPTGCVVFAVSSSAAVFLLVKGRVDIEAEISKAQKKLERASENVRKQRGILDDEGFRSKVADELQEVERRKLRDAEAECREFEESIQQFERLKLE